MRSDYLTALRKKKNATEKVTNLLKYAIVPQIIILLMFS